MVPRAGGLEGDEIGEWPPMGIGFLLGEIKIL